MIARLLGRARRHRGLDFVLFAGLVLALLWIVRLLPEPEMRKVIGPARVIDGDSLSLAGEEVRLRGIDAPELAQPCERGGVSWACGREAADRLRDLISGAHLTCDAARRDKHRRLLGVCRIGELEINRWMVESGWAVSYDDYPRIERAARDARRGIWAGTFERPVKWRGANGRR